MSVELKFWEFGMHLLQMVTLLFVVILIAITFRFVVMRISSKGTLLFIKKTTQLLAPPKTAYLLGCRVFILLLSKAIKAINDHREHKCISVGCYTRTE